MPRSGMELQESVFNGVRKSFEGYPEQPIIPEMIKQLRNMNDLSSSENEMVTMDNRRESSISVQSDLSLGTTVSEPNLPHMKCFRTPSVVVSDHSEEIGCVTLEEIEKVHGVYHRRSRSRSRSRRRHSDVFTDLNSDLERTRMGFFDADSRTESSFSGSANSDVTEYYKGSKYTSPVPKRKSRWYRSRRKAFSLDETAMVFDCGREGSHGERKYSNFSECSSNELSPILSRRSSYYSDTSSRRSSIFSEISPVLLRKNVGLFDSRKNSEFSGRCSLSPNRRRSTNGMISPVLHSRDSVSLDDIDIHYLERQRSLSVDDLMVDSSVNSDMSFSDVSTDFSASSSLSNLTGVLYYSNYSPGYDYSAEYRCKGSPRLGKHSKSSSIKTSKSCSDFLSVNRILEDYPNLRRRRHSNGQVPSDITEYREQMQKINEEYSTKWFPRNFESKRSHNNNHINVSSNGVAAKNNLCLRSFHESMNRLNRENEMYVKNFKKKSKSIESIVKEAITDGTNGEHLERYFRDKIGDQKSEVVIGDCEVKVGSRTAVVENSGGEWMKRCRKQNGEVMDENFDYGLKTSLVPKSHDCGPCSTLCGDVDLPNNLAVRAKSKVSFCTFPNFTADEIMSVTVSKVCLQE